MKYKILAAMIAAFLMAISFSTVAYAGGGEELPPPIETPTPESTPEPEPKPFTPPGTGTVIDNATDEDGKEFFTIMTPDENVFYLIIDRQRENENVYFLNAVTEKDLLALAEKSEDAEAGGESAIPELTVPPVTLPEPVPEPEPATEPDSGGNMGMLIAVALVVLVGGGAAYYFKIYRPKQERAAAGDEDEYEYEDSAPFPGDDEMPPEDNGPPWYEDEDEQNGDGEK